MSSSTDPLNLEEVGDLASIIMVMQRKFLSTLMGELSHDRLSFPQFFLLGHLIAHGPTGMTRVAELMGHSTPAATGLVQRLEKLGYVKRNHELEDRRKVTVTVTAKGTRLVEGVRQEIIGNLSKVKDRLTPKEQRAWLDIYKKIHEYCTVCNS
jgi:DNA-binding MarR family transcriptional regulator